MFAAAGSDTSQQPASDIAHIRMDDYALGPELGRGEMGIVYLVTRKTDNRQLAAKRMCLATMSSEEKQKAFDEAKNLAAMTHPNLCSVEDSFIEHINGQDYLSIIMEHCAGGSLRSHMKDQQDEPFHNDQIKQWLNSICLALAHLHRCSVVHRDLKPENIFLTEEGIVKVSDFGTTVIAAKIKTEMSTYHYLAPEVLDADESEEGTCDYRSDLWSLGVILYELITFKLPFQATSRVALGKKIRRGKYGPLRETTPLELRDLVKELLKMDPLKRPDCTEILSREPLKPTLRQNVAVKNGARSTADALPQAGDRSAGDVNTTDKDKKRESTSPAAEHTRHKGDTPLARRTVGRQQESRPNSFVAVRVFDPEIVSRVGIVQNTILEHSPAFRPLLVPLSKLHITLHVMRVEDDQIERAVIALHQSRDKIAQLWSQNGYAYQMALRGIGHFRDQVLFARVDERSVPFILQLADVVRETFEYHGFPSTDSPKNSFKPHITIAKMSQARDLKKKGIYQIQPHWYKRHVDDDFGKQLLSSVQLCSMVKPPSSDGYYYCESESTLQRAQHSEPE